MRLSKSVAYSFQLLLLILTVSAVPALSSNTFGSSGFNSGGGGLGTPRSADVTVQQENGVFLREGKATDPALVRKLVEAVQAIPKLNLTWETWHHRRLAEGACPRRRRETRPGPKAGRA
jgi:hypothetical protein